jgi:formylglycine-generating enzyme required for sulfatase activity
MKTHFAKLVRFLCALSLPICAAAPRASAQPASLDIQLYAGLTITGAVDTVYSIQYVTDLAQTNAWRCLAFLQLPATNYLWADTSAPSTGQRFYRAVADVHTNLVFIPPGSFRMGSPTNAVDRNADEGPQTAVTLTKGFYVGNYLVTQGDYLAVLGSNPSFFRGDTNRPVEQVSWNDATNYCAKRTLREVALGLIPAGSQYRLPTEAEWEYACRAWTSDRRFFYGDDPGYTELTDYAWYSDNSSGTTHAVGQKLPNAWGLYDVVGNAQEWCQDWYGQYQGGSVTDPQGPASGSSRVARGGGWGAQARNCQSALRTDQLPSSKVSFVGFRVVLAPDKP